MSDFLLHKSPDKARIYAEPPGIRYSDELRRWFVTAPELIREVLYDDNYVVPGVNLTEFTEHLGLDLETVTGVIDWAPLVHEGDKHKLRREQLARLIARNNAAALEAISAELERRLAGVADLPAGQTFCLYSTVVRPVMISGLLRLADVTLSLDIPFETLPQMLDQALPVSRRKKINALTRRILDEMPAELSYDEKHVRSVIVALGVNTLLGSVCLSLVHIAQMNPGVKLSEMDWPADLPCTAVPHVERRALADCRLGAMDIRSGDIVRVFLESAGLAPDGTWRYSDVFFALGSHKCVGLNFSRQTWTRFVAGISTVDRPLRVIEVHERDQDYLFNYPDRIMVAFDD